MNARAMLLSLITGLGHIYLRHYVLGAALFALFAASLNGIALGLLLSSRPVLARALLFGSGPLAFIVWTAGLAHAWKISYGTDRARLRGERRRLFREGLVRYLRDDLDGARDQLRRAVECDVDWEDPDALFHLGTTELRLAERRAARGETLAADRARRRGLRSLAACLRRDDRLKWRAEVQLERQRAQALKVKAGTSA